MAMVVDLVGLVAWGVEWKRLREIAIEVDDASVRALMQSGLTGLEHGAASKVVVAQPLKHRDEAVVAQTLKFPDRGRAGLRIGLRDDLVEQCLIEFGHLH